MEDSIPQKDRDIINDVEVPKVEPVDLSKEAPVQAELDINIKEQQKQEKTRVNARDNSYLKKLLETPKEQPGGGTNNNDEAKRRLLGDNQPLSETVLSSSNVNNESESKDNSEIIVEIVDWILVAIIHWFSAADSDRDYQTDTAKKNIIKKHFAKFLAKKQEKYPTEFFLVLAFVSTYFFSAKRAYSDRKINLPIKQAKDRARKQSYKAAESDKKKRKIKDDMPYTQVEEVK